MSEVPQYKRNHPRPRAGKGRTGEDRHVGLIDIVSLNSRHHSILVSINSRRINQLVEHSTLDRSVHNEEKGSTCLTATPPTATRSYDTAPVTLPTPPTLTTTTRPPPAPAAARHRSADEDTHSLA